jgi:two-component system, LytTR family, response regulator
MLKVLLVDDEKLALMEMQRLLKSIPDVEVVGLAMNGEEALTLIKTTSPHLVLLDIRMPEMTGLELAARIPPHVHFVFCTAYNDHAFEAFELNAVGYLMKPIEQARLTAIVQKIKSIINEDTGEVPPDEATYLPDSHGLLLKSGQEYQIIKIKDIDRVESVGNHVAIYALSRKLYLHVSLSKIEKRLNPHDFIKASRSDIVRLSSIKTLEDGMAAGTFSAVLNTGDEIEISRRQAHSLRKFFSLDVLA